MCMTHSPISPPEHVWNIDEKGIQFGGGRKCLKKYYHLRSLKKCKFYRVRSDNLELMTIIECISPSRLSVPPSFVLSSGCVPSFPTLSSTISAIAMSPNGWMDNEIGMAWFIKTFIPFANSYKVNTAPILLLLDGHNSYELDAFRKAAFQNNSIVITFPSKCIHKLQPLDVVVFAQTQRHWLAHCDDRIIHHVKMDRYNIIPEYMEIRLRSMTPKLMRSAFSTTGIFLFNDALFTDDDFAPAKSFSHLMHAPTTFPLVVPSSAPISSDLSNLEMSDNESSAAECVAADTTKAQACDTWDTDADDFNYGFVPSHVYTSDAAPAPTEALPSPLTVPVTGTDTSSQHMQAM